MADLASWDEVFASVEKAKAKTTKPSSDPAPKSKPEPESWDDVDAAIKDVESGFNPEYLKELRAAEAVAQIGIDSAPIGVWEWGAAASSLPPEYRRAALERSAELFKERGPMKDAGFLKRTAVAVAQGGVDMGMPVAQYFAPKELQLTGDQEAFRQALISVRQGNDPSLSEGSIASTVQQAARMAPPMLMMGAAGRAAGTVAKSAGLGATGVRLAQGAGVGAAAYPMAADQSYRSLVSEGVDPEIAAPVSRVSGLFEGVVESIIPDPFKVQSGVLKGSIRRIVTEGVRRAGVQAGRIGIEAGEEAAQAFTRESMYEIARAIDEDIPNQGLGKAFVAAAEEGLQSIGPLAVIMGPSMTIGAVGTARNTASRPEQYQAALERRDFERFRRELAKSVTDSPAAADGDAARAQRVTRLQEILSKGFVSEEEAKQEGIEGKNRKERKTNAENEIEDLQKPSPWNDKFLAEEDARIQQQQGQQSRPWWDFGSGEPQGEIPAPPGLALFDRLTGRSAQSALPPETEQGVVKPPLPAEAETPAVPTWKEMEATAIEMLTNQAKAEQWSESGLKTRTDHVASLTKQAMQGNKDAQAALAEYANPKIPPQVSPPLPSTPPSGTASQPGNVPPPLPSAKPPLPQAPGGAGTAVAGAGRGIVDGLYQSMYERLQAGKYPGIAKTPADDAVAAEHAREPFKTADEIRQFVNDGSRPVSAEQQQELSDEEAKRIAAKRIAERKAGTKPAEENQSIHPPSPADPTTLVSREGIQRAMQSDPIGAGGNARAYAVSDDAVVRVPHQIASELEIKYDFKPVDHPLTKAGIKAGQPFAENSQGVGVLHRQKGVEAGLSRPTKGKEAQAANDARFAESIKATASLPQSAYDEFASTIKKMEAAGYTIDPSKSSNFLIDVENGRINIVDPIPVGKGGAGLNDMVVPLIGNTYMHNYKGEPLTPAMASIFSKAEQAAKNAGLDTTLSSGGEWSRELAGLNKKPVDPVSELDEAEDEFGELAKTFDDEEETAPSTPVPPQEQKPASTKPVVQLAQSRDELIAKRDALQAEADEELSIDRGAELQEKIKALNEQIAQQPKQNPPQPTASPSKPVEQPKQEATEGWDVVKGKDGKLYREDPNAKSPSERISTRQAIDPSEGAVVITKDQWGKPIPPETLKARQEFADKAKPGAEFEHTDYKGQSFRVLDNGTLLNSSGRKMGTIQDMANTIETGQVKWKETSTPAQSPKQTTPEATNAADAEPPIPKFTRTTPDKGSTTRQDQSGRVEKARTEISGLERKRRDKQGEHDKLRSNATKKRAAVRGEIESFNRMIGKMQGEIAADMASDTTAKLEDELESPRSYDHYLAGMKAIHKLKASVAEDAARRGEMGREAARSVVSKEEREADRLDAELQGRAKDIAMSKGFTSGDAEQIALAASNGFTVFEDRSLADVVEVQGKRTRESRVSQEISKLKPSSPYGQKDLSNDQVEDFTKQYQEASLDDKNWLAKRGEVDKAVKEAINANREASRKREDEERKAKEAEKAKDEQEALANARERAKKYFLDERISKALKKQKPKTKSVKIRQESDGGPVKIVEGKTIDGDQDGELYPNGLILHKTFEEDSKDFVLTPARSGSGFPFSAKKSDMQELIGLLDILGLDFNVDTDEKGALPSELTSRVKKINTAWDNGDYATLSEQDYATVKSLAEVAKTDIDADLILTADDLGANGIPPGLDKVFTDRGLRVVKGMAEEVPEFAYDPVFTVKDGMLLYRDGYEFNIDPTAFNLHPSELKEGQTVGINLEDLGINRATPQDVVAEVMKGTEIPRVTKTKGGAVSVGYVGARPTTLQQGESDNDWSVVGGTPKVQEIAVAALKKIRWRQPGQDGDPKTDIDVVPVEKESVVAKKESESDIVTPLDPVKRIENVIEQGRATGREPSKAMLEKLADAKAETNSPMDSLPENGYIEGPKGGKLSKPQFEVGERVQVGNSQGVVESVNLRWSGTGPKGSAYKDSYKVRFDSGDLANAGSLSMDGNDMKKAASVEPVTETPKPIPSEVEFMEMSVGVNAPGVNKTIRVTAGDRTLLMERSKHDSEWSIREGEKYTGEVKGKNPVKTKSAILASGIVETKKAKEIAQRIIDGTFDKDADNRFVREDTQNIGLTNAGIAESMKGSLGGKRDSFAKLLREQGLVTDGRILMKVNDKDRDAILKGVGETDEGRSLDAVSKMMTDGQKALSRSANAMKPIGYRGGYLTPRTVVLQSQDGDSAIIDKSLHDTILKKYPNAVPYFLEDGKPISYAVDGDLVAIVMPMNMDKPDAKVKALVAGKYDFDAEAAEAAKFPPPQPKTKLKKAAEKASKELSNAVDEFGNAIKGKLGMNLPLNPEVIAAAAKVVTKAIEAGVRNFAELMERIVTKYGEKMAKRMEAALQQEWDRQVNAYPVADEDGTPPETPQPHPELVPPEAIPLTSVKNAIVDELRAQRGEDPMPEVTPQTVQQWLDAAGNRIASDPYAGNTLVEQLLSGEKTSVDEMEGMVLQYHYRAVNNLFEAADTKLTQAKTNGDAAAIAIAQDDARVIMRRLAAIETALDKAGTAWGRAGVSRQIFLKQDFSLASMVRRARVANGGNELSDEQVAKISEQAKQIEELQKRIAELEAKTAEQEQAKAIDEAIKKDIEETKKPPAEKPKSKVRLKAEERVASAWEKVGAVFKGKLYANPLDPELLKPAMELIKAYADLGMVTFREFMYTAAKNMGAKQAKAAEPTFRAAWDQLAADGEISQPSLDITNVGQLTRFARQVQRSLVENGVTEREEIVDAVHDALREILPEITRRQTMDALSSYGQFSQLSKDPIDQIIRDINGQLQQLAKLEDMEKGIAPAKTGVERRSQSDEERRLTQLVNEAKRRGGFVVTDPETQLKSAMAAAKTAVRNRIADMTYEIQTGSRVVRNKTELIPDAELEQLRKDRDALRQVHKDMFPPKGATQAQKIASANRALDAAIASLEAKLAAGDISPAPQAAPLSTPELDAKRARLKALHDQRNALRKTDEQTKVRALDRSIEALEKELAAGDFTLKPKPDPLTSPEINARQAKLESLRATKKALVAAANPNMADERASRAYEAHLRTQLAMYMDKIAQGDFAPKQKKQPRVLTQGELDLKKQLADVKHDFFEALSKYHLDNLSPVGRAIDIVRESAHLSRAIMTSIDLSAVLRQGGLGVYSHPAMARKAAAEMWRSIWSREKEFQSMEKLRSRPNAQLYEESGLNITDSEGKLTRQEEAFMGRWARTGVDFAGKKVQAATKLALEPVAASARAYVTFINNLRADLFDVMVENLGQGGAVTKEEAKLIAKYINVATGRADLKALNEAAATLNTVFFAPRYVASRFQYLAMPFYVLGSSKNSGRVKMLIAKEYARTFTGAAVFIGSLTALAYLAAMADDDEEEKPSVAVNPFAGDLVSSDLAKVRIGETRIDALAGLAQVIVFSARMASFRTKNSTTGKIKRFYEGGPYETTHGSEAWRFMRTKLAPVPGAAVTAMSGMKDVVGDPVTPAGLVGGLFVPISLGEVYSTMRHRGVPKGTALAVLNIMGASVNTYGPKTAYLDATPEDRAKQVNDYIKHMDWESDLPAFSEYLKPEELKQVQDRQNERRGDLVFEAMGEVKPKKDYKTEVHYEEALERHKKANEEFEEFRKQYAPTYTDALRYLTYHFDNEGGIKSQGLRKAKPSFVERKSRLMKYYESRP